MWPCDAIWHGRIWLSLGQVMTCCLFGARALAAIMTYCQLNRRKQISLEIWTPWKFEQNADFFHWRKFVVVSKISAVLFWPKCVDIYFSVVAKFRAGASTEHTSTVKSVLEYNVFSILMFIILGKTSTRVLLGPSPDKIINICIKEIKNEDFVTPVMITFSDVCQNFSLKKIYSKMSFVK